MYLKLLVFSVLIYDAFCYRHYSYQLPDAAERKSLNVAVDTESFNQFQITIECYNFDSLKYFEMRLGASFELRNGILLNFIKCFNNATDHENNNYELSRWFNSLPYFVNKDYNGYPITFKHDEYAEVNADVLFKYFDFRKFDSVTFYNLGFVSMNFLNHLYCRRCVFENNGIIDFNYFSDTIAKTKTLDIINNKLVNLNSENLRKFIGVEILDMRVFDLDDLNAFNVPDLFVHNTNITEIKLVYSKIQITLHDHVLRGLKNLRKLKFERLQLDYIPKDLFKNLENLYSVSFASNNIKSVDPVTFQTTYKLSNIIFIDNPFFTEPHDKLEAFHLGGEHVHMSLGNFTEHTFDLLEHLINHRSSIQVIFNEFLIKKFNITDFTKMDKYQNSSTKISFLGGEPELDLEHIKSFGNIIRAQRDLPNQFNTVIRIKFADAMCYDCAIIKYFYPHFLQEYRTTPGFYFEGSRLFINFVIPKPCKNLNEYFEVSFDENCPQNCTCKFNSVVDKVKIDCNNKNLSEIPIIPYPEQFDKLHSIDLNFENNLISVLSLDNQDVNVTEKLSTLNFKNNKVNTIGINEEDLSKNIWALDLCDNPIVEDISYYDDGMQLNLASGSREYDSYYCSTDHYYPNAEAYIRDKINLNGIDEYLNGLKCNSLVS